MTTEVYIVDPDVWRGSADDPRCCVAVLDVWQRPDKQLALDGDQIEREYIELLGLRSLPTALRKLLQEIFNNRERSPKIRLLSPISLPLLESTIRQLDCNTPIEPELIRVAAATTSAATKLLLVGDDRFRRRGLHQRNVAKNLRTFFRSTLHKGFGVVYAKEIGLPSRNEHVQGLEGRIFEDQVRSVLMQKIYRQFGQMPHVRQPTPSEVYRKAGEVDVYLYADVRGKRYVWVCECQLREAGNENKPVSSRKVLKLQEKVQAIKVFEDFEVGKTSGITSVIVRGYMVTNAHAFQSQASRIIEEHELHFCRVRMPKDWETNYRWRLSEDDISDLEL
jgi:hypothetical protein